MVTFSSFLPHSSLNATRLCTVSSWVGALAWPAGSYPHLSPCLGGGLAIHSPPHPVKSPTESDHTASLKVLSCWWLLGRRAASFTWPTSFTPHPPPALRYHTPHCPGSSPEGLLSAPGKGLSLLHKRLPTSRDSGEVPGEAPPPWLSVRGLHSSDRGHPSAGSFSESRCPGDMQAPREQPCLSRTVRSQ